MLEARCYSCPRIGAQASGEHRYKATINPKSHCTSAEEFTRFITPDPQVTCGCKVTERNASALQPAGNARRCAGKPAKMSCEMAVIRETDSQRDFGKRQIGTREQAPGLFDTSLHQIGMRR